MHDLVSQIWINNLTSDWIFQRKQKKAKREKKGTQRNSYFPIESLTKFPSVLSTEMKVRLGKTKVVMRCLPPSLTQSDLVQQIDNHFAGRYNWFSFRPGKNRFGIFVFWLLISIFSFVLVFVAFSASSTLVISIFFFFCIVLFFLNIGSFHWAVQWSFFFLIIS